MPLPYLKIKGSITIIICKSVQIKDIHFDNDHVAGPADELPGLRVLGGGRGAPRDHVSHENSLRQHLHPAHK